jgi:type II secretory pathway component GspD/PulD (secretin)
LLLASFGLSAQTPPAPSAPDAPASGTTNREEVLRRALLRAMAGGTNAPDEPAAVPAMNAATPDPAAVPPPNAPAFPAATIPAPSAPAVPAPAVGALPAGGAAAPTSAQTAPNAAVATPPATNAPAEDEEIIPEGVIDWTDANLNQILKIYQELVHRTIIRAGGLPAVAGVAVKTATPITRKEEIQLLDKILALNGIAMINIGDKFVVATPAAAASGEAQAWDRRDPAEFPPMGGQYVTRILQTTNAKPSELAQVIQLFVSGRVPNPITAIDSSQMLVLRDYSENVKRMLEMIKQLDISVPAEFVSEVIMIKYAKAGEIASALNSLSGGGGSTTVGGARGSTRQTTGGPRGGVPGAVMPGAMPGVPAAGNPSSPATFSDRLNQIIRRAATATSGDMQILGQTRIISDERTNSLLIFAWRQDMEMIKDIISKLDVVLPQVLIESIIIDVALNDSHSLGLSYLQTQPTKLGGNNSFNGVGGLNNVGFLTPGVFSAVTNSSGSLGSGLSYLGKFGQGVDVTLTALASDSSVKVIQRPSIMTFHATKAHFQVGTTVPMVSSTYYGGGYAGGPSSSYQQQFVGIDLSVTPYINPDGLVVMEIDESINDLAGTTAIVGVGNVPNTSQRVLSSEVAVRDRETIVLGGYIHSSTDYNKSGMPILKDIPLVGPLFTTSSKSKARSELMVLMRPTVLRTPEIAAAETSAIKRRLPGISSAEAENAADEAKRVKMVQDELGTPDQTDKTKSPTTETNAPGRDAGGFLPLPQSDNSDR